MSIQYYTDAGTTTYTYADKIVEFRKQIVECRKQTIELEKQIVECRKKAIEFKKQTAEYCDILQESQRETLPVYQ